MVTGLLSWAPLTVNPNPVDENIATATLTLGGPANLTLTLVSGSPGVLFVEDPQVVLSPPQTTATWKLTVVAPSSTMYVTLTVSGLPGGGTRPTIVQVDPDPDLTTGESVGIAIGVVGLLSTLVGWIINNRSSQALPVTQTNAAVINENLAGLADATPTAPTPAEALQVMNIQPPLPGLIQTPPG
jgi:hypothetical protein